MIEFVEKMPSQSSLIVKKSKDHSKTVKTVDEETKSVCHITKKNRRDSKSLSSVHSIAELQTECDDF